MQNIKDLKIGRYSVKIGKFPNGFRFNIFAHDKSLFGKGVEDTEENAIKAARSLISERKRQKLSRGLTAFPLLRNLLRHSQQLSQVMPNGKC